MASPKHIFLKILETNASESSFGNAVIKERHLEILKKLQHYHKTNEKMKETVTNVINTSYNADSGSVKQDISRASSSKDRSIGQKRPKDGETTEKSLRSSDIKNMSRSSAGEDLVDDAQTQISILTNLIHEIKARRLKARGKLDRSPKTTIEIHDVSSPGGRIYRVDDNGERVGFSRGASGSFILQQGGEEEDIQPYTGSQSVKHKPNGSSQIRADEDVRFWPENSSKSSTIRFSPGQSPREEIYKNFMDNLTPNAMGSKEADTFGTKTNNILQDFGENQMRDDQNHSENTQEMLRNILAKQNKQTVNYRKSQSQGEARNEPELSEMEPFSNTVDYNKDVYTLDSDRDRGGDNGNADQRNRESDGYQYNPAANRSSNQDTGSSKLSGPQTRVVNLQDLIDSNQQGKVRRDPSNQNDEAFQDEIERQYQEYLRHYNSNLPPNGTSQTSPYDQQGDQNDGEEYEEVEESLDRKRNEFKSSQAFLSPHLEAVDERHPGEEEDSHGEHEEPYEIAYHQNVNPSTLDLYNRFKHLHTTLESVPERTIRSETHSESPMDSPHSQRDLYHSAKKMEINLDSLQGSHPTIKIQGSEEKRSSIGNTNKLMRFGFDLGSLPVRPDFDEDSDRGDAMEHSNLQPRELLKSYYYNDSLWDSVQFYNVMDPESFIKPEKRIDRGFIKDLITPKRNPRIQSPSNIDSNVERFFRSRSKSDQRSTQSLPRLTASGRLKTDSIHGANLLGGTSRSRLTTNTSTKGSAQRTKEDPGRYESRGGMNSSGKSKGKLDFDDSNRMSSSKGFSKELVAPFNPFLAHWEDPAGQWGEKADTKSKTVQLMNDNVRGNLANGTQDRRNDRAEMQTKGQLRRQQEQSEFENGQQAESGPLAELLMSSKWFQQGPSQRKR